MDDGVNPHDHVLSRLTEQQPIFGDGPFPADLKRFNWAAFLMPGVWSLFHGRWMWWLLRAALLLVWLTVLSLMRRTSGFSITDPWLPLPATPFALANYLTALWFGMKANEQIWRDASKRRRRGIKVGTIPEVMSVQRGWAIVAIVWALIGVILTVYGLFTTEPPKVVGGTAGLIVWSTLELIAIGVAAILASRLRQERVAAAAAEFLSTT